jgi:glyoxylate/hydroxypyruvate reductase A
MMIVTLPLTQDSRGVVSANVLHALKRGAIVINVGRGATVDEGALLAALDDGSIGGAYLDVFSEEPLPAGHAFWSHPRATVTPHVSGGSWDLLFELFTQNLIRYANEVPLLNLVSPERGY